MINNIKDLRREEKLLQQRFHEEVRQLRMDFARNTAKFKVGDFVGNVTGIIKVSEIGHETYLDQTFVIYKGLRYKKVKGELLRTKDSNQATMRQNHSLNLKKINHDINTRSKRRNKDF